MNHGSYYYSTVNLPSLQHQRRLHNKPIVYQQNWKINSTLLLGVSWLSFLSSLGTGEVGSAGLIGSILISAGTTGLGSGLSSSTTKGLRKGLVEAAGVTGEAALIRVETGDVGVEWRKGLVCEEDSVFCSICPASPQEKCVTVTGVGDCGDWGAAGLSEGLRARVNLSPPYTTT